MTEEKKPFKHAGECKECGIELGYEGKRKVAVYEDQFSTPRFWVDVCDWVDAPDGGLFCSDCEACHDRI